MWGSCRYSHICSDHAHMSLSIRESTVMAAIIWEESVQSCNKWFCRDKTCLNAKLTPDKKAYVARTVLF